MTAGPPPPGSCPDQLSHEGEVEQRMTKKPVTKGTFMATTYKARNGGVRGGTVEREKALEVALLQIEKQFGKGAVMRMGEAQRLGGIAAFIDAEHALDVAYARNLGINTDELLISQPDTGEQALEIADMLVRSGALDVIVIDSVAALVPRAEIEGEMGDSHVGLQARLMSQALRKIAGALNNSGTTAIFINQLREKIGVMFGSPETTTGGKALKFYASVRLDVRRIETLKDGGEAVGNRTRVKVVKNKCLAEGTLVFDPTTGVTHRIEEIVDGRLLVSVVAAAKDGTLHARPVVSWFDQGGQEVLGL